MMVKTKDVMTDSRENLRASGGASCSLAVNSSNLSGCPWCGETKTLFIVDDGGDTRPRRKVFCPMCNILGPEGLDDNEATEQWNRRAT